MVISAKRTLPERDERYIQEPDSIHRDVLIHDY